MAMSICLCVGPKQPYYLSMAAPTNRLPADLTDLAALPDCIARASEGFGLEWYEMDHGYRSVILYRFTRGGTFSWSQQVAVRGGETYASIISRANDLRSQAA